MSPADEAVRNLLTDAFSRLIEHAETITADLPDEVAAFRPTPAANSIAWLLWHSARIQDLQVAQIAGVAQTWHADGWAARFALALPADDTGYGHQPEQVARVQAEAAKLIGYYRAVHRLTLDYLATVTVAELSRVVDDHWHPPVTAGVRLVSIVDDCAQHLGQAAYLRGIAS